VFVVVCVVLCVCGARFVFICAVLLSARRACACVCVCVCACGEKKVKLKMLGAPAGTLVFVPRHTSSSPGRELHANPRYIYCGCVSE